MSKTHITIAARRRPKKAAKRAPEKKEEEKGGGGVAALPGDRYIPAECRITVADLSTLYMFVNDETDGHAIIGSSNNSEQWRDTGGVSMPLDPDEDQIIAANVASLDLFLG